MQGIDLAPQRNAEVTHVIDSIAIRSNEHEAAARTGRVALTTPAGCPVHIRVDRWVDC
jgi:hypothetical protein